MHSHNKIILNVKSIRKNILLLIDYIIKVMIFSSQDALNINYKS
jgi:hypothetical protein